MRYSGQAQQDTSTLDFLIEWETDHHLFYEASHRYLDLAGHLLFGKPTVRVLRTSITMENVSLSNQLQKPGQQ